MQHDVRWLRLKDRLLDRGWTTRDDALHAPHDTLWFSRRADDANLASFRRRMTAAATASAAYVGVDDEHAALHEDLVSLVEALDEVFDGDAATAASASAAAIAEALADPLLVN